MFQQVLTPILELHRRPLSFSEKFPICLGCLKARASDRERLKQAIAETLASNVHMAPDGTSYRPYFADMNTHVDGCTGPENVFLKVDGLIGFRKHRHVREKLEPIKEGLGNPVKRFRERLSLNPNILETIESDAYKRDDLLEEQLLLSAKRVRGSKGDNPAFTFETKASNLLSEQRIREYKFPKHELNLAIIASGLPTLNALLDIKAKQLSEKSERILMQAGRDNQALREYDDLFAWELFEFYIALMGETEIANWMATEYANVIPGLCRVVTDMMRFQCSAETRTRIIGDVAIIQYLVTRNPTILLQAVRSKQELLDLLEEYHYPRIYVSKDKDPDQRVDAILTDIAASLETATVLWVNCHKVLKSIHFTQTSPRSQKRPS